VAGYGLARPASISEWVDLWRTDYRLPTTDYRLQGRAALPGGGIETGESQGSDDGVDADADAATPESRALSGESDEGSAAGVSALDALMWAGDIESQFEAAAAGKSGVSDEATEADLLLAIKLSAVDTRTQGKKRGFSEFMNQTRLDQRQEGAASYRAKLAQGVADKAAKEAAKVQAQLDKEAQLGSARSRQQATL